MAWKKHHRTWLAFLLPDIWLSFKPVTLTFSLSVLNSKPRIIFLLYKFPWAAEIKVHKLSGLSSRNFFSQFWGWMSKISVNISGSFQRQRESPLVSGDSQNPWKSPDIQMCHSALFTLPSSPWDSFLTSSHGILFPVCLCLNHPHLILTPDAGLGPILIHHNLVISAKTLFPNKITCTDTGD